MADNTTLNVGSGGDVIATEDLGAYKLPVSKLRTGAQDVDGGDVTTSNPLPVGGQDESGNPVSPRLRLLGTVWRLLVHDETNRPFLERIADAIEAISDRVLNDTRPAVSASAPIGAELGYVVRNIPTGTQTVGTSDVRVLGTLTVSDTNAAISGAGALSTVVAKAGSFVQVALTGHTVVTASLVGSGSFSGTLVFEISPDGTGWIAIPGYVPGSAYQGSFPGGQLLAGFVGAATTARFRVSGYSFFRVRSVTGNTTTKQQVLLIATVGDVDQLSDVVQVTGGGMCVGGWSSGASAYVQFACDSTGHLVPSGVIGATFTPIACDANGAQRANAYDLATKLAPTVLPDRGLQVNHRFSCLSYSGNQSDGTLDTTGFWTATLTNGGTSTQSAGVFSLLTNTTSAGLSILQSQVVTPLRPGTVNEFVADFAFATATASNTQSAGAYDGNNGYGFKMNGTTLQGFTRSNGVDTSVAFVGAVTDTKYHHWRILYDGLRAYFYQDDLLVASTGALPLTTLLTQNDQLPIRFDNTNGAITTALTMNVRHCAINSYDTHDRRQRYIHLAGTGTTVIKRGPGSLRRIVINAPAATATMTVYDNTAGSGTVIAIPAVATLSGTFDFELDFANGLTVVIATASPDVTIVFD